jgi:xanthine dehydrogenase iron-sulfur cluster and FAD-binding subunit A
MIMTATDMIRRHPEGLDEKTVRAELEGNICRCTGYHNIVKAILAAAEAMAAQRSRLRHDLGRIRNESMIPKIGCRFSEKIMVEQPAGARWQLEEKPSRSGR